MPFIWWQRRVNGHLMLGGKVGKFSHHCFGRPQYSVAPTCCYIFTTVHCESGSGTWWLHGVRKGMGVATFGPSAALWRSCWPLPAPWEAANSAAEKGVVVSIQASEWSQIHDYFIGGTTVITLEYLQSTTWWEETTSTRDNFVSFFPFFSPKFVSDHTGAHVPHKRILHVENDHIQSIISSSVFLRAPLSWSLCHKYGRVGTFLLHIIKRKYFLAW